MFTAEIEPGDDVVRYSRVYQRKDVTRYSVTDEDVAKIVAAVASFDWAIWAKTQMEKQQAKGTPTAAGESLEDSASVAAGERVATSTVQAYEKPRNTGYYNTTTDVPPAKWQVLTHTPEQIADRAAKQKRGRYKKYAELEAEAAGKVQPGATEAERYAAIQAQADRYAKAGIWKSYETIAHELGI